MKTKYLSFFYLLICINFNSCGEIEPDGFDYYQVPHTFYFVILDSNGNSFINKENSKSVALYYLVGSQKEYISDLNIADSNTHYAYICASRDIAFKSASGIKNFYLDYKNADIDTVYLDVVEEKNRECMCMYPYKSIKFNNEVPETDETDLLAPYVFRKK